MSTMLHKLLKCYCVLSAATPGSDRPMGLIIFQLRLEVLSCDCIRLVKCSRFLCDLNRLLKKRDYYTHGSCW